MADDGEILHNRVPSSKSFETTHTIDTDISMPSHIQIPNLPNIQEAVLRIGDSSGTSSQPPPVSLANESPSQKSDTGREVVSAVLDAVTISIKRRPLDEFGFFQDSVDATPPYELKPKEKKEIKGIETEWLHLLDNWTSLSLKNKTKIKKLSRKGIPESLRGRAWIALTGSEKKKETGKFEMLCTRAVNVTTGQDRPPIFDVIDRDVHRCFPTHIMFAEENGEGQSNIRKVLQAYALYNPSLGYCQGMGMIVGMLLMRMSPEDAFWTLVVILDIYMPDYHSVNLYQLRVDAAAFDICMRKFARPLQRHMSLAELTPLTYMTQWFLTVYTMALPWKTVLRIWDMFLHDGPKALFRAGLAILIRNKSLLLRCERQPSDLLEKLLKAPREINDSSKFVDECLRISLGHKQLEKIREQVKRVHSSLEHNSKGSNLAALA